MSLQIDYLIKLLQLFSNKVRQTNKQINIDLGLGEIDASIFFGTIILKISRNNRVAKCQQLHGNVGSSQQETYKHGTEMSNGTEG